MKKCIFAVIFSIILVTLFAGRSATPHPVYIELHDSNGNVPLADSLEVKCWLDHKPEQVLDLKDSNVIFPIRDVFLQIQCSGFDSWSEGDSLHVEVTDHNTGESLKMVIELTFENFQLFSENHLSKPEEIEIKE